MAGRGRRCGWARRSTRARPTSGSATTDLGSPRPTGGASSNASPGAPAVPSPTAPGWGSPSSRRSSRPTTAGWSWPAARAAAPGSRWSCRWRPRSRPDREPDPDRRGRASGRRVPGQGPTGQRLHHDRRRRRRRRPGGGPVRPVRPAPARPDPAAQARLHRAQRAARCQGDDAGDRPHRQLRHRRHPRRAAGRRRRLHDQAVPVRGAARPGAAAVARRPGPRGDGAAARPARAGPAHPPGAGRRLPGRAQRPRVPPRRDVRAQRRPGALPAAAPQPRLGLRPRPRLQRRRRQHLQPSPQARDGRDPDRQGHGLPVGGGVGASRPARAAPRRLQRVRPRLRALARFWPPVQAAPSELEAEPASGVPVTSLLALPAAPAVALGVLVAAYVLVFGRLTWAQQSNFGTFGYDMGLYDQGIWLVSRFKDPFVTIRGLNFFEHHVNLITLLFVPAYWLGAGPHFLYLVETVWMAAGAVALACKEDAALAVIMLGLVLAVRGERRAGLLTTAAGAGWFLLATKVIIPAAGGGDGPFYQELFPGFGDSLGEIVWNMVVHPSRLLELATMPDRLTYYWRLLAPVAFMPLAAPLVLHVGCWSRCCLPPRWRPTSPGRRRRSAGSTTRASGRGPSRVTPPSRPRSGWCRRTPASRPPTTWCRT